jgi:hypothetical protein
LKEKTSATSVTPVPVETSTSTENMREANNIMVTKLTMDNRDSKSNKNIGNSGVDSTSRNDSNNIDPSNGGDASNEKDASKSRDACKKRWHLTAVMSATTGTPATAETLAVEFHGNSRD